MSYTYSLSGEFQIPFKMSHLGDSGSSKIRPNMIRANKIWNAIGTTEISIVSASMLGKALSCYGALHDQRR